jgi:glycine cleavage system H protein
LTRPPSRRWSDDGARRIAAGTVRIPDHLKYTASHEWVAVGTDGVATIGITAVAADHLGELVYVGLPGVGRPLVQGESCAVVESTKAAAEVCAPVSGEVVAVNAALADAPQTVNEAPYETGWLFKVKLAQAGEAAGLMGAAAYRAAAGTP